MGCADLGVVTGGGFKIMVIRGESCFLKEEGFFKGDDAE